MKSVLVIDDNQNIRENTAEILDLAGYKTFVAENGKQGFEVAIKENPSVIVCDIMMPELDGYGVLHLLRQNVATQKIPFIFLTARAERSDFRKGMEMGADDYIMKPFEEVELLTAIETRLRKAEILEHSYASTSAGITQFINDVKQTGLLKQLEEQYAVEYYQKKQRIYESGKRPKYLYYLSNGKAKAFKGHEDGKEYITDLFGTGDFIGYAALIEEKNYDDTVVALDESEVLRIPREDFMQMIFSDIAIAVKFIRIATNNIKEKEERLLNLAYSSLRKRVAKALVDLHGKFNIDVKNRTVQISREDLAHYVGTATESLIRILSDFKAEKLIDTNEGKIIMLNVESLKNLVF